MEPADADTLRARIERDGFAIVRGVLDAAAVEALAAAFEASDLPGRVRTRAGIAFGSRNALALPAARAAVATRAVRDLVVAVLGPGAIAVRGLLFDKVARANWRVPWHQDLVVAVRARREAPGFAGWSVKAGVPHVQPPAAVLAGMLAVRLHLDDAGADAGALRVLPGTHADGRLAPDAIARLARERAAVTCAAGRGDAVLMRPLLLHASSPATRPARRRVLHVEHAAGPLPAGLEWHEDT